MPAKKAPVRAAKKRAPASKAPAKKRAAKVIKKSSWTDSRKDAFVRAREETRVVDTYLASIAQASRPGRRRAPDSVAAQLRKVITELHEATGAERLALIQRRRDLEEERNRLTAASDTRGLEDAFVKVAQRYSERKGISYATWREAGVPARVLSKAGISRERRKANAE